MRCEELRENLSAWLDGELTPSESAPVEGHLQDCPACQERVKELRALWNLLGADTDQEPTPEFPARVHRRIREGRTASLRRRALFSTAAAAAAVLLFLIGMVVMGQREMPSPGSGERSGAGATSEPDAFAEVEKAVQEDPELLEILNHLDALGEIELLENLPLFEKMDEFQAKGADDLVEASEILLIDGEIPLEIIEQD
ncbi:MAG: anti-sigma factor family protein [Planctomycetota bacterium]|jgi:hypothetical protein